MAMPMVGCFDVEVIVDMSCLQDGLKSFINLQIYFKHIRKLRIRRFLAMRLYF